MMRRQRTPPAQDGSSVHVSAGGSDDASSIFRVFNCVSVPPVRFVPGQDRETAGSLMPFFLILGLALGASLSFPLGKLV